MKKFRILSLDYPQGTEMNSDEMKKYAKQLLKKNKIKGYDKHILAKELDTITGAWEFLKSKGFGKEEIEFKLPSKPKREKKIIYRTNSGLNALFSNEIEDKEIVHYMDEKGVHRVTTGAGWKKGIKGRKAFKNEKLWG